MDSFYSFSPSADEKKQLRSHYFRIGIIIAALLLIFNGLNFIIMKVCAGFLGGSFDAEGIKDGQALIRQQPLMNALHTYAFPILGELLALALGLVLTGSAPWKKFGTKNVTSSGMFKFTAVSFAMMTAAAFINMVIVFFVMLIAGKTDFINNALSSASVGPSAENPLILKVFIYLYMCILGPVLEELVFRGVLLDNLSKYGNAFGIIASSLLFGLMHQNYMQCIPAFAIGVAFAFMTVKTGSLLPSVIVHIFNNSLSALMTVLMENSDLTVLNKAVSVESAEALMLNNMPLMIAMGLNILFRLVCIIAAIVIAGEFISSRRRLAEPSEFCRKRTWSYFLTSLPCILSIAFMAWRTFTSLPI